MCVWHGCGDTDETAVERERLLPRCRHTRPGHGGLAAPSWPGSSSLVGVEVLRSQTNKTRGRVFARPVWTTLEFCPGSAKTPSTGIVTDSFKSLVLPSSSPAPRQSSPQACTTQKRRQEDRASSVAGPDRRRHDHVQQRLAH